MLTQPSTTSTQGNVAAFWLMPVVACLLAIWPLPNTMGLRHLLLLTGCGLAIPILMSAKSELWNRRNWSLWIFLGFFAWLLVHFFFMPINGDEQFYELRGDWLRAFLASMIGLALALRVTKAPSQRTGELQQELFIAGLSGTVVIYMVRYGYEIVQTGVWMHKDFFWQPYLGKTPMVVFGSVFLCALFAKLASGLMPNNRMRWLLATAIAIPAACLCYFLSNTKNGFIVFLFIFGIYSVKFLRSHAAGRWMDRVIFALILVILAGFLTFHIQQNPAWLNFYADVQAGHDIENNQNWKNNEKYPLPVNARGVTANASAYERSAWATAGIQLVKDNPLGYGLINHSFGALAFERWPDFYKPIGKYRHASHSGWLDFTLGFGLPGLLMVQLPMWVAFRRAAGRNGFWFEFVRWSVPVVSLVYLITEVCTGHFIEFLFFYVAFISGITLRKKDS